MGKPKNTQVPDHLVKYYKTLRYLNKCQEKPERKSVVSNANRELIQCICECVHNVVNGNIPISKPRVEKLAGHKKKIAKLLSKQTGLKQKKKLLIQSGGFLPLLLTPILGIVGSLIGDAISRRGA